MIYYPAKPHVLKVFTLCGSVCFIANQILFAIIQKYNNGTGISVKTASQNHLPHDGAPFLKLPL